jgi:MarR family transcriptional regulator, negative regulator of the multidrug operon emrRAB
MSHAYDRDANVVGALALAIADRIHDATSTTSGVGASGPAALAALHGMAEGTTIDGLRRVVGLTHSGGVRLVDRLVAAGLVERRVGADQRSVALRLTPAGRRAARRVLDQRAAAVESALAGLPAGDREALARIASSLLPGLGDERLICRLCDVEACGRPAHLCPMQAAGVTSGRS